jgi:hypothetical protein
LHPGPVGRPSPYCVPQFELMSNIPMFSQ